MLGLSSGARRPAGFPFPLAPSRASESRGVGMSYYFRSTNYLREPLHNGGPRFIAPGTPRPEFVKSPSSVDWGMGRPGRGGTSEQSPVDRKGERLLLPDSGRASASHA